MERRLRFVTVLVVVILLAGGTAVAAGFYQEATSDCTSGNALSTYPLEGNRSGTAPEAVAFEDLSPEEQRIFLEALEDEHNVSRTYEDWSPSLFADVRTVNYRGQQYRVTEVETDCASLSATLLKMGGAGLVLVGLGMLLVTVVWQGSIRARTMSY